MWVMKMPARCLLFALVLSGANADELERRIEERDGLSGLQSGGLDLNLGMAMPTLPKNIRISSNTAYYNRAANLLNYDGRVILIADNGTQIYADTAILDSAKKRIDLRGKVKIYQGSTIYTGRTSTYFYETQKFSSDGMQISMDPILLNAQSIETTEGKNRETIYIGRQARITTHDVEKPNFWLKANKIIVHPKQKVIFKNVKVVAGETPIFWLPYLAQSLDRELNYHFVPGARSNWGPFLLNRYGIMLGGELDPVTEERNNATILAQFLFDMRFQRGLGFGVDLFDVRQQDNPNLGWLKLYYTNDLSPSTARLGIGRGFVDEDRYRIELKQRFDLWAGQGAQTYIDANLTWLSDRYYLEDFEPARYVYDAEPDNTIGIFRRTDSALMGAYTRFSLNDFYQSDSRLPELFYEQIRRPLFGTRIMHEGSTSLGFYREELADFRKLQLERDLASLPADDPRRGVLERALAQRDFIRFHTWQELSSSFTYKNAITLTPRAGMGLSTYWQEGRQNNSLTRKHFFLGLDTSAKFSKLYPNIHSKKWGIQSIMHVVQPYANASLVSTNELDPMFSKIDRFATSTYPRQRNVGSFAAIDDLRNWAVMRLGVRNQLLTRRDGGTHQWLTMNTYMDYFFHDPEFDRDFSNLHNDLFWYPVPWMAVSLETQFKALGTGSGFSEVAAGLRFMPSSDWEIDFNYRMLDNFPNLDNSTRIDIRAYTRLTETWGLGIYHQWELDDGTLEIQQYTVHRDCDSWIASVGLLRRDNRTNVENSLMLGFTLKEFPDVQIPLTIDRDTE